MPKKRSTSGRPYRRRRAQVLNDRGGVCGICGLPIDHKLEAPHPKSPSVHHDPPISHAGERGRLVAAHLGCNRRQGNRGAPPTAPPSDKW